MISKNKAFLFFSIFFLLGIFLQNIFIDLFKSLVVLGIIILLFFIYFLISKKHFIVVIVIIIGFLSGTTLSSYNLNKVNEKSSIIVSLLDTNKVNLLVEIKNTLKKNDYENQYIAEIKRIETKSIEKKIYGIIILPSNMEVQKGYIIESKVKLYSIKNFDNFDYKNYLISKNIYFKSYINTFDIKEKKKINIYNKTLIDIRQYFLNTINKIYTPEEAIFLGGILVGARESMPENLKTDFNNSGLTHFIAVSGFNITILIIFLGYFFSYFPLFLRVGLITLFIISFTVLVGDTAPVIRATIMGLVGYYIIVSGRQGNALSIILLTASIMVIFSPLSINYDVSFHLSFLAVIGIVYTQGFFTKIFNFLPKVLAIRESFVLTMASLTFTLPIIIFNFGQISLLAPIANILVAWTIPLAMLFGFLSIIVYFIFPFLGVFIGYFTWILLKWDILVVHYFGQSSWAILKFNFGILKNYLELLYFIILIFIIMYFRVNKKNDFKL